MEYFERYFFSKTKNVNYPPYSLTLVQPNSFSITIDQPHQIADYFNNFFSTVGERTSQSVEQFTDPLNYMQNINITNSFFLYPTSAKEVFDTIMCMKSKYSTGYDNLSNILIKQIASSISEPLAHVFNLSFEHGTVPDSYKLAKVIPIHKLLFLRYSKKLFVNG